MLMQDERRSLPTPTGTARVIADLAARPRAGRSCSGTAPAAASRPAIWPRWPPRSRRSGSPCCGSSSRGGWPVGAPRRAPARLDLAWTAVLAELAPAAAGVARRPARGRSAEAPVRGSPAGPAGPTGASGRARARVSAAPAGSPGEPAAPTSCSTPGCRRSWSRATATRSARRPSCPRGVQVGCDPVRRPRIRRPAVAPRSPSVRRSSCITTAVAPMASQIWPMTESPPRSCGWECSCVGRCLRMEAERGRWRMWMLAAVLTLPGADLGRDPLPTSHRRTRAARLDDRGTTGLRTTQTDLAGARRPSTRSSTWRRRASRRGRPGSSGTPFRSLTRCTPPACG